MLLERFEKLQEVLAGLEAVYQGVKLTIQLDNNKSSQALVYAQKLLKNVREKKGKVVIIGNGGSAGIASHFCCDLIRTLGISSQTLFDSNVMTCIGNDFGYENIFANPLKVLLEDRDLLVAISSSGKSENILNACRVALQKNASIFTLSGFSKDNSLRVLGDLNFWVPSSDYGLVEMAHFFLLHTIVDTWDLQCEVEGFEGKNSYIKAP